MPTSPGYAYFKTYGVEPWKAVEGKADGGAKVTGDNLVITLWRTVGKTGEADAPVAFGPILTPLDVVDTTPESQTAAFVQSMHGRVGAQWQLFVGDDALYNADAQPTAPYNGLLAVCAPPQELKQQLANSVEFVGGTPGAPPIPLPVENYNFLKPQTGQFAWEFSSGSCETPNIKFDESAAPKTLWIGQYIPLNITDSPEGLDETYLPLLKTDGADGETPEFFDMATTGGVAEAIAAVNKGNFFVPIVIPRFGFSADGGGAYQIAWPYSASRG